METGLLHLHNVLRWVVVIAAVLAVVFSWRGALKGLPFERGDRLRGIIFTASMDLQLLLGLVLYAMSDLVAAGVADMSAAMADRETRFFLVEHISIMLIAVVLVHVGTFMAKRAPEDRLKHRKAAIFYTISLLLILGAIPWWRPLFPG